MPAKAPELEKPVEIDLDRPMKEVLAELTKYPVKTRLKPDRNSYCCKGYSTCTIKKMIDEGKPMPEYFKNHPVYYAGPAKTPKEWLQEVLARLLQDVWIHMWIFSRVWAVR